ncbi:MAG: hypothetical protein C0395_06230 [Gemmatimonas sp.]|nr:hypothetical protein [Gemmatimonas sp.]
MRTPVLVLLVLFLLGVAQAAWYAPQLPVRPATDFAGDGAASGWSDKDDLLTMQIVLLAVMAWLFPLIGWSLRRIPVKYISLPHPEYWLAPSRLASTLASLARSLAWLGCGTTLFMLWSFQLTILANFAEPPRMATAAMWSGLAAYLAFSTGWTLRLILSYQRLPRRG